MKIDELLALMRQRRSIRAYKPDPVPDEVIQKVMLEPAAIKRLVEPEEVAALVVYLTSDLAGSITGSAWELDLGWTAR